jgi:cobalt-zinc-cadmium efflux system outer membrane protein
MMSCSSLRKTAIDPDPRPLVKNFPTIPESIEQESGKEIILSNEDTLTLTNAIQRVLLQNPELRSYSIEIRAREARTLQESFAPNPEIQFEFENIGGSGDLSGFRASEFTVSIGQLIELAGKRDKRTRTAAFRSDLAAWDYETKKLDVFTETVIQYIRLIGVQEQIVLNEELVSVSEKLYQAVNRLVKAGKISPAELSRTRILLSTAQSELNRSMKKFEADRYRLSSLWGETSPGFKFVAGTLEEMAVIPPADSLKKFLSENPDNIRWVTELELSKSIISLEESKQVPDPTIQAGYRHLSEIDLNAFVATFSIPIPIFDNNTGAVQEAYNRRKKVEEQRRQTEVKVNTILVELYQNIDILSTEIDHSKNTIIPEAEKAFKIINDGYLFGKFSFLDVLASQRTLFEARKTLITLLIDYNIRIAEMERLIGRKISAVVK